MTTYFDFFRLIEVKFIYSIMFWKHTMQQFTIFKGYTSFIVIIIFAFQFFFHLFLLVGG